jgi:muramidase (phage lysozyme)
MVVNGVFRKYHDPFPNIRVRAFLKVLREWECHEESDDIKRYFLMLSPINGSRRFTDTSKHPHEGVSVNNTAAGAYQFTLETYQRLSSPPFGIGPGFTPALQDRFAVAYLEILPENPLASVRKGNISSAADSLARIWSSLPGGRFPRKAKRDGSIYQYTMDDLLKKHTEFMKEISA